MRSSKALKEFSVSLEDFLANWMGGEGSVFKKQDEMVWIGLGVVGWALWKIRNKMAIERELISSPAVIIYNIISLM
jgi:hypothetical protein